MGTQVAGHDSSVTGWHQGPGADVALMISVFELESPLCSELSEALGRSSLLESQDAHKGHFETHFTDQGTVMAMVRLSNSFFGDTLGLRLQVG